MRTDLDSARDAVNAGELVVYPTETVYGLGANALEMAAIERVFAAKKRPRSKPLSMAVPDVETARRYVSMTEREVAFASEFLPGPVTLVVERRDVVPDALTAGRERVGIRVPDHDIARALAETGPVTATSANVSGRPGARRIDDVDERVLDAATVVLDDGETPGGGSTVVDVTAEIVHRRGADVEAVETWLEEHCS